MSGRDLVACATTRFFGLMTVWVLLAFSALPVHAIENLARPAAIVVDAKTGRVLYESEADSRRYPASVTKIMTLYVLFQELAAGNLALDTPITASQHAADARPTELGLRRGSTLTVEEAIQSMIVVSANDSARAVAELIAGTESRFAERMTATARALGMTGTNYANASGWPDPNNFTTARDQAVLGVAIYQHFPQYYHYFNQTRMNWGGRSYTGHNNVLGYRGIVDGLKTGWTSSSGSTILTSARGENRHIVLAVLGYSGASARDSQVRDLVARYFDEARSGDLWREALVPRPGLLNSGVRVALTGPVPLDGLPPRRPVPHTSIAAIEAGGAMLTASEIPLRPETTALDEVTRVATGRQDAEFGLGADDPLGAWIAETLALEARPRAVAAPALIAPVPVARPEGLRADPVVTNGANVAPQATWLIQVGAVESEQAAQALLDQAVSVDETLAGFRRFVEPVVNRGRPLYRARFAGFGDRHQASAACEALAETMLACLALSLSL